VLQQGHSHPFPVSSEGLWLAFLAKTPTVIARSKEDLLACLVTGEGVY